MRNGESCMCFVCDFNGRWLKNSNLLCRFVIILNVGYRIIYIIQVGCFIELEVMYFFKDKE